MPIRWDPKRIIETAERLEKALLDARPYLDETAREAAAGTQIPNLPEYMKYPLQTLQKDIGHFHRRMYQHIRELTNRIPDAPEAKPHRQEGPQLF